MTRKGKIARLPQSIREQLNRRLQNGDEGKQIVAWLKTVPQVKSITDTEFDGQAINETNLSNWKQGGYVDWQAQQASLAVASQLGSQAAEITQAGAGEVGDHLVTCLIARLAVVLQQPPPPEEGPADQVKRLRGMCRDLGALRKSGHREQRLRLEREKLELALKKDQAKEAARQREIDRKNNPKQGGISKEFMTWFEKEYHML